MKLRWPRRRPGRVYRDFKRTADAQDQAVREAIAEADRVRMRAVQTRIEVLRRTMGRDA